MATSVQLLVVRLAAALHPHFRRDRALPFLVSSPGQCACAAACHAPPPISRAGLNILSIILLFSHCSDVEIMMSIQRNGLHFNNIQNDVENELFLFLVMENRSWYIRIVRIYGVVLAVCERALGEVGSPS